jgi:hypothetical protein
VIRGDDIRCWLLRHAERLLLIVGCIFFGVLGLTEHLTTFLLGSSLDDPSAVIHLDGVINVSVGTCCVVVAAIAARRLPRGAPPSSTARGG